jgi:GntR family transcriptional regulator, rspAB operon transcriptional repressor
MHPRSLIHDGRTGEAPSYRLAPLSKSEFAYYELRRRIICGDLAPGTRLDLNVLCETLEVSRMPVREALSRLDAQGLVKVHPQHATVVSPLSAADLRDTYGARIALESLLAGAGAGRVDETLLQEMSSEIEAQRRFAEEGDLERYLNSDRDFHDLLYERADMTRTCALVHGLRDVADRYIYLFLEADAHRWESIAEHEHLLRLCGSGDAVELQQAVALHIARGRDALQVQIEAAGESALAALGTAR